MMEAAETTPGVLELAELYSSCMKIMDALLLAEQSGTHHVTPLKEIEVERARLLIWADAAGLADIDMSAGEKPSEDVLADVEETMQPEALRPVVADLLASLVRMFEDASLLRKWYGIETQIHRGSRAAPGPSGGAGKSARKRLSFTLRETYARFRDRPDSSQRAATPLAGEAWVIKDEKKFRGLVGEIRAVNDSLRPPLGFFAHHPGRISIRGDTLRIDDVGLLQRLVDASDDAADPVAEMARLRIRILSRYGPGVAMERETMRMPPSRRTKPAPVSHGGTRQLAVRPPPEPTKPVSESYDNTGALGVREVHNAAGDLSYDLWLSGGGKVPELSATQPEFHAAFGTALIIPSLTGRRANYEHQD